VGCRRGIDIYDLLSANKQLRTEHLPSLMDIKTEYICYLHNVITRHQKTIEYRDSRGAFATLLFALRSDLDNFIEPEEGGPLTDEEWDAIRNGIKEHPWPYANQLDDNRVNDTILDLLRDEISRRQEE
jgi:hypothetical protein